MEYLLMTSLQDESEVHVGAWSTYITVSLPIFAAFVARFHTSVVLAISAFSKRVAGDRNRSSLSSDLIQTSRRQSGKKYLQRARQVVSKVQGNFGRLVWQWISELMNLLRWQFSDYLQFLKSEWLSLKRFWQDLTRQWRLQRLDAAVCTPIILFSYSDQYAI